MHVGRDLISRATDAVMDDARAWQRWRWMTSTRVVLNQSSAFQHLQVLADGRSTDRKQLGELTDWLGSRAGCLHDLAARRITQRIEGNMRRETVTHR